MIDAISVLGPQTVTAPVEPAVLTPILSVRDIPGGVTGATDATSLANAGYYIPSAEEYNKIMQERIAAAAAAARKKSNGIFGDSFLGDFASSISGLIQDLGPIGQAALIYATGGLGSIIAAELGVSTIVGNALASAGLQIAQGAPIETALTNAATSYIGGSAGSAINSLVDEVSAAQTYGTDLGSQQTAMLAAQDAGMGTVGDLTGNVAGGVTGATTAAALKGQDLSTAALSGALNAGTSAVASTLAGATPVTSPAEPDIFTDTTAPDIVSQPLASTVDQEQPNTPTTITPDGNVDAQGNPTYVNEQGNPVDVNGTPIENANTRTPLEGGGFKTLNPDGSITYEDPDGSVYKVNPDGTYTTQSLGTTNTYNPSTGEFTQPPTTTPTTQSPSTGLTQQQIDSLLKAGTGLLTGAVVAPAIVNAVTGSGSSTSTTTPSTGTTLSSALNPYNAAYFQQVQQNYNRLFPTAPADIATPLQSWYDTKYVPDTTISKKLFGV